MTKEDIQRALATLGFDPGPADGDIGPRTKKAVEAFQRGQHLIVDGKPGKITQEALTKALAVLDMTGRAPPKKSTKGRPVHTLVWHCTATPEGKEFSREAIREMHLARGFSDIGYHKLIHLDGSVSEGRPESQVGAHVANHNTGTLGYSYVGGVDAKGKAKDTRTPAQRATMARLTADAVEQYGLRAIAGHRDFSPDRDRDGLVEPSEWIKVCPCFDAAPEYRAQLQRAA